MRSRNTNLEAQLMSAVAEPQHSAPAEREAARLFDEHAEMLYGLCIRRLGSRSDAEDAVQTTFLHAFRALRRGIVPESEAAWLTAIATNVCRSQLRTRSRRGFATGEFDLDQLPAVTQVDFDQRELCHDLRDALASIPATQRRALVLREWHGLSAGDVAAQLGMSQPATYALLTRARRSLTHAFTALPQRAALTLAAIVYDLRSHVKTLLEGAATKVAATTTVVAAVAVIGASAPIRNTEDSTSRPLAGEAALTDAGAAPGAIASADGRAQQSVGPAGHAGTGQSDGSSEPSAAAAAGMLPRSEFASPTQRSKSDQDPTSAPESLWPATDEQTTAGAEPLPPLPEVELPSEILPPTELPPGLPPAPPLPPLSTVEAPSVEPPPADLGLPKL
jgi:RNA polymerase sigma-70 factor, ECF subfamily